MLNMYVNYGNSKIANKGYLGPTLVISLCCLQNHTLVLGFFFDDVSHVLLALWQYTHISYRRDTTSHVLGVLCGSLRTQCTQIAV